MRGLIFTWDINKDLFYEIHLPRKAVSLVKETTENVDEHSLKSKS